MSMEAMKNLTETEQKGTALKETAILQGRERLAEVQRAGNRMLEENRTSAEAEAKDMMSKAEAQAEVEAEKILAQATADCKNITQSARERLGEAAALIAERVVNS